MKKVVIIFIVLIYALSTTGFALKADYCCDKLQSVKLVLADGAKDKEGCCKAKYQAFKIKDAHAAADDINTPAIHAVVIHTCIACLQSGNFLSQTIQHKLNIHSPPLVSPAPVYLSNRVLRI